MSNHSWRSISSCRYALVTLAPLVSFLPPFAVLPISTFSMRAERVVLDDAQLIVQVLAVVLELLVDDLRARLSRAMPRG